MSPARKARSVPGRIATWTSAAAEVRVKRGSTWTMVAPRSRATRGQWKPTGCDSAMFDPMTSTQSLFAMSRGGLVAAPNPNEVPRPDTVELCQSRAWFSVPSTPSPPVKSFFAR